MRRPSRRGLLKLGIIGIVLAVVGVVGGPYVYIHFIKEPAPKPLSFDSLQPTGPTATTATTAASAPSVASPVTTAATGAGVIDFAGTWTVAQPSQAGYRVKEILFGQDTEGVGRTDKVDGTMTIAGNAVTAGEFNVDLATVASDQTRRDNQFRTRLMNTEEFPVATYTIVEPIDLAAAGSGAGLTTKVVGTLSLRGVEKPVTVDVSAQRSGAVIQVTGSADIVFADFGIPDPSNAAVSTQNHGKFEFAITLAKSP